MNTADTHIKKSSEDERGLFDNLTHKLWTYDDLSKATSLPTYTLQKLVWKKRLTPLRIGRYVRFEPNEAMKRLKEIGAEKNAPAQRRLARNVEREREKEREKVQGRGKSQTL